MYFYHNLDHFIMQSGRIGRMQCLSTIPVCAGDVIDFSVDAFLRFSPMRKPVEIPSNVDFFAFYAPSRWYCPDVGTAPASGSVYAKENSWNHWIRRPDGARDVTDANVPKISGMTSSIAAMAAAADNMEPFHALAQGANLTNAILPSMYQTIWRSYFRDYRSDVAQDDQSTFKFVPPYSYLTKSYALADYTSAIANTGVTLQDLTRGLRVAGLPNMNTYWNRYELATADYAASVTGTETQTATIDLNALKSAGALAEVERQMQLNMSTASDVLRDVYSGYLDRDAEKVPWLIAKCRGMQVARDIDGTGENLGTSTGKSVGVHHCNMVQKMFPEHGYIMIMAVVRFPNIGSDMTLPIVKRHPLHNDKIAEEARSDPRFDLVEKDIAFDLKEYNTNRSVSHAANHHQAPGDSYRYMPHRCSSDFEFVPGSASKRQGFPVGVPDSTEAFSNLSYVNEEIDMFLSREFQDYRIQGQIKCNRNSVVSSQYEAHMAGTFS